MWIWFLTLHGIHVDPLPHVVAYQIRYATGQPITRATVQVLTASGTPLDTLYPDTAGRIVWIPPDTGTYTFRVVDPGGHGVVFRVAGKTGKVEGITLTHPTSSPPPGLPFWSRVVMGVLGVWAAGVSLLLLRPGSRE